MSTTAEVDARIQEIKEMIKKELNYTLTELEMKLYRRFTIKEIIFGINFIKQTTYTIKNIARLMYSAIINRWSYGKKKAKQFIEKAKEVIANNKAKTQFNPTQKPKNKFMNFEQTPYDFEKIEKMELERTLKKIKEREAINNMDC